MAPSTPTKSGIQETSDGQRVIPASVRADGTMRREIKVKPGYRPPEDVEVYKNRTAEAWKNRGSGGVPGAAPPGAAVKDPAASAAAAKNAKRRARKKAKDGGDKDEEERAGATDGEVQKTDAVGQERPAPPEQETAEPTPEEKEKQAKAIRKKIRQASELKSRKDGGENLLPEQLDKIIKMSELTRQLKALGMEE